jgi:hypothetical protein
MSADIDPIDTDWPAVLRAINVRGLAYPICPVALAADAAMPPTSAEMTALLAAIPVPAEDE